MGMSKKMLTALEYIPDDVSVLVVYLKDDEVLDEVMRFVHKRYTFDVGYMCDAVNLNDLHVKQKEALYRPLLGDKWLIRACIDNIAVDAMVRCMLNLNGCGFYVYYTHNYSLYRKLSQFVKLKNSPCVRFVYAASFTAKDMYVLYNARNIEQTKKIPPAVMNFVVKQYRKDCGKYLRLLQLAASGAVIQTPADVVQLVGLGALTIDTYLIDLLRTEIKPTPRSYKRVLHRWVRMYWDLKQAYSTQALVRILQRKLDAILTVKLLQVEGLVIGNRCEIPENYDTPVLQSVLRYSNDIADHISAPEILWLRNALQKTCTQTYITDVKFCNVLYALALRRMQETLMQ